MVYADCEGDDPLGYSQMPSEIIFMGWSMHTLKISRRDIGMVVMSVAEEKMVCVEFILKMLAELSTLSTKGKIWGIF